MVLLDLWSNFKVFHRRRRILKKNFSRYEDGYKYIVVELHKKRAIKAFRTLKEAKIYLNDIGEYYRAKNYNVFMNSYSRSLSISSVAQYIKEECNKKWCNIYTICPLLLKKNRGERRKGRIKNY